MVVEFITSGDAFKPIFWIPEFLKNGPADDRGASKTLPIRFQAVTSTLQKTSQNTTCDVALSYTHFKSFCGFPDYCKMLPRTTNEARPTRFRFVSEPPPNDTQTWSKRDMRIRVVDNSFQLILWTLKFLG